MFVFVIMIKQTKNNLRIIKIITSLPSFTITHVDILCYYVVVVCIFSMKHHFAIGYTYNMNIIIVS